MYIRTIGSMLSFDAIIALTSSTSAFALSSIFIFIVGLLCGHYLWKRPATQQPCEDRVTMTDNIKVGPAPVYENLTIKAIKHEESPADFELKSNISYGPLPIVTK